MRMLETKVWGRQNTDAPSDYNFVLVAEFTFQLVRERTTNEHLRAMQKEEERKMAECPLRQH